MLKNAALQGPAPTTKWRGSALLNHFGSTDPNAAQPFSQMMFALPLPVRSGQPGLGMTYVPGPSGQGTGGYSYNAPSACYLVAGTTNI